VEEAYALESLGVPEAQPSISLPLNRRAQ